MGRPIRRTVCPCDLDREILESPFLVFENEATSGVRDRVFDVLQSRVNQKVVAHQVELLQAKHIVEDLLPLSEDTAENKHWMGVLLWLLHSQKDAIQDVWVLDDLFGIYMDSKNKMQGFLSEAILDKVNGSPNLVQRIEKPFQAFMERVLDEAALDPVVRQFAVRRICKFVRQNKCTVLPALKRVREALLKSTVLNCKPADRDRLYWNTYLTLRELKETICRFE